MMRYLCTLLMFFSPLFARTLKAIEYELIDDVLLKELGDSVDGLFPASWAYANEGGVIKYGELDILGDDRREIILSRSTDGYAQAGGTWVHEIYFQAGGENKYTQLEGDLFLGGFQKKENGKSVFLKASEGNRFSSSDEPAFTKKLVIQEVSEKGVINEVSIIDNTTEEQLREMWEAALLAHEETSRSFMEKLGFKIASPNFKWISLEEYLAGGEWQDDNVNDWSALNEFSVNGVLWKVPTDSISPAFLDFARKVHKLDAKSESGILPAEIDFPEGYLTPRAAYLAIAKKQKPIQEANVKEQNEDEADESAKKVLKKEKANSTKAKKGLGIFALVSLILGGIGVLVWNSRKGSSAQ